MGRAGKTASVDLTELNSDGLREKTKKFRKRRQRKIPPPLSPLCPDEFSAKKKVRENGLYCTQVYLDPGCDIPTVVSLPGSFPKTPLGVLIRESVQVR